jgi:integrase
MHVRKLPSGRYRWIVQLHGQRRDGTADTRGEAKMLGHQAYVEMGGDFKGADATVEELLAAWQADRADGWSPTYASDIANVINRLPEPFLERKLRAVVPTTIVAVHRELTKDGWSPHRRRRVHWALVGAWKMAVGYGWASTNPVRDLAGPKDDRSDIHPPDHATVRALLAAAPERIRVFLRLAAITGARRGELVALQWADVSAETVTIRRTIVYAPEYGVVVREHTKTGRKGDRRLEVDETTAEMLATHRGAQARIAAKRRLPSPVWVFSNDGGATPWRPDFIGQEYRRLRATVPEAEGVRLHDLRHYVITTMLGDGESLYDAAAQAGHSRVTTTADVYAHYLPGRGRESATKRAGRLR